MSKTVRKRTYYSDSFKMQVVHEALEANSNKAAICRKYSIGRPDLLRKWIHIFAPKPNLEDVCMKSKSPTSESEELKELKRQNQQIRLELKQEKMRADLYNEIINVAEEMFNIPIRKKAGTKQ